MRFNPPPNWPAPPPGWVPPPDWQPDPSWPPPPPDWQFWVPDETAKRGRTGLIVGASLAAVVVAIVVIVALVVTRESEPSDDEQIRAVITGMQDAWNESDYYKFRGFVCAESLGEDVAPTEDEFKDQRKDEGRVEIRINEIDIIGDAATAEIVEKFDDQGTDVEDLELVRENGQWKACFT